MGESSTVLQDRHYVNPFKDFSKDNDSSPIDVNAKEIHKNFQEKLTEKTIALLKKLEKNKMNWYNNDDQSIYTGLIGIAFLFYHYGRYFEEPTYLSKAAEMVQSCVSNLKSKRQVTFLTGSAGPLALGAVIYDSIDREESEGMILKLKSLSNNVLGDKSDLPDELLYGRAGYLFSLLFVNSKISPPIDDDLIKQVIASILKSGRIYSMRKHSKSPLMYAWHDKEYLGGAHGLGGILYLLLQARHYLSQSELKDEIEPSLKYLQKLRFPSGNFPSSVGNESDKLIHWCHGAPSMTMLFTLAYKVFDNKDYLETSIKCGEVIWNRGLLKKGYSICHGVPGNAYSFLNLFQETKDEKHLYRACKFAEWCFDYGSHQLRTPDRPFSLFEGLAGTIYFLIDLQKPMFAKFPAYTL
ncbi:lanC-like protein 2 [Belonocnema kinseyi]|uniref:lanC-like protein 2 n=1 Tax=Belonocnema kinseyi TaxID=2817044 RepID=UPI00143DC27D|nr:lanC-like protein 2 [Belonocnema kinseyi]XP_033225592.1 lanC-like protein 2 [Belonocnema kinseyi]XP_033225593.1 lanC-like protein 2 [Belonocnema kinseyi]XP_033225594.1 lanC-like protein 2 [Belonocnema kinseyi]